VALLSCILFVGCNTPETLSGENAITSFEIENVPGEISEHIITVTVPYGTNITSLSPIIAFTGSMVNPASGAVQDFTSPVTYQVTADDSSIRNYVVIVRVAKPDAKAITSFAVGSAIGEINEQAITVTVPYGTDITSLSPVITFTGSAVSPASGAVQDFTSPVTYRVTAYDGSTADYRVTVQSQKDGVL
jgi:hypothetical protein